MTGPLSLKMESRDEAKRLNPQRQLRIYSTQMRMRWVYFIVAGLLAGVVTLVGGTNPQRASFDHTPLQRVLTSYVGAEGRVDYAALKKNRGDLGRMIQQISAVSPDNKPQPFPTREAKLAYWINAYNAWILRLIVDNYPTSSITKIGLISYGVFFIKRVSLGGEKMTLRDQENDIIGARFHDARIPFAINCASASCPPLSTRVYLPEALDEQLTAAARIFLNDDRQVKIEVTGIPIELSKIFDWYASDFTEVLGSRSGGKKTVVDYIRSYLNNERRQALARIPNVKVNYQDYDWSLNDQARAVAQGSPR